MSAGGDELADELTYDVGDECALGFAPADEAFGEEIIGRAIVGVVDVVAELAGIHVGSVAPHVGLVELFT